MTHFLFQLCLRVALKHLLIILHPSFLLTPVDTHIVCKIVSTNLTNFFHFTTVVTMKIGWKYPICEMMLVCQNKVKLIFTKGKSNYGQQKVHGNGIFQTGNRIFMAPNDHEPTCFFQSVSVPCGLSDRLKLINNPLWVTFLLQTSRGNSLGRNGGGLAQGPQLRVMERRELSTVAIGCL